MLDGRVNDYHRVTDPNDERWMGDGASLLPPHPPPPHLSAHPAPLDRWWSGIAQQLTGTHGRADVDIKLGSWGDEPSQPFRDLIANPTILRCAWLPDSSLLASLGLAMLRGVAVESAGVS